MIKQIEYLMILLEFIIRLLLLTWPIKIEQDIMVTVINLFIFDLLE